MVKIEAVKSFASEMGLTTHHMCEAEKMIGIEASRTSERVSLHKMHMLTINHLLVISCPTKTNENYREKKFVRTLHPLRSHVLCRLILDAQFDARTPYRFS